MDLGRGIPPDITREEAREAVEALPAAGEAALKLQRLMQLLLAAMPQWRASRLTFRAALRRDWPRR